VLSICTKLLGTINDFERRNNRYSTLSALNALTFKSNN